jgi:nucleoside-diphosphate-sugar epimerase
MKYLVLGSRGQIGSSLVSYLRDIGHIAIEFDIRDGMEYDLRTKNQKLHECLDECDFVFFLAWDVGGSIYLQQYQNTYDFIMNNVQIISNTFDAIKDSKKPFIFASSQMSNMSYSSYGITKSIGERITSALGGITVKFWNVYGHETDPEKTHVVTDFINMAKMNKRIDMRTDGSEVRQMLYADDCSQCLYALSREFTNLKKDGEYHVTSFKWISVLKIAEIVSECFPETKIYRSQAMDTIQRDLRNEPSTEILKYWKPVTDMRTGINFIINKMNKL